MSHDTETWKPIPGFEHYEASSMGRVRSLDRGERKGRILKPRPLPAGYERVQLGRGTEVYIHRLVCFAFYGKPKDERMVPNHKNGIKNDNRVENLEWVTLSQNKKHAFEVLGIKPWNWTGKHHKTRKEFLRERALINLQYLEAYEKARVAGVSQKELAESLGFKLAAFSMRLIRAREWRKSCQR